MKLPVIRINNIAPKWTPKEDTSFFFSSNIDDWTGATRRKKKVDAWKEQYREIKKSRPHKKNRQKEMHLKHG